MKVTWYRHFHENRNDLLRYGLMKLNKSGKISYKELRLKEEGFKVFGKEVENYPDHKALSFILVEEGERKVKCIVDNEDSFALVSPLIKEADVYFCAGYNSDFFEKRSFVNTYNWQKEEDVQWYRKTIEKKIETLGDYFYKVKK